MKTKVTLTVTHEGKTFTRTTDHKYTFAVVIRRNRDEDTRRAEGRWNPAEVASMTKDLRCSNADARRYGAQVMTLAEYLAVCAGYWKAEIEKTAATRYEWDAARWSGSRSLAETNARQLTALGFDAVVVPING